MSMTGKEMKICLPLYKVLYSLAFVVILSLIRGVTHTYEVGIACEAPPGDSCVRVLRGHLCAGDHELQVRSVEAVSDEEKGDVRGAQDRDPAVLASAAWGSRIRDVLPVSGSLSAVRSRDRRERVNFICSWYIWRRSS